MAQRSRAWSPGVAELGGGADNGFALLAVTVVVAALALIVCATVEASRQHVADARGSLDQLKVQAAIDAAILTALSDVTEGRLGETSPFLPRTISVAGTAVTVSIRPENAKIGLNIAPASELSALFRAAGMGSDVSTGLAEHIVEWRNADPIDGSLDATGSGRDFGSVAELGSVADANDALVTCVQSDFSVFVTTADVDIAHASQHVRSSRGATETTGSEEGLAVTPGMTLEITARARQEGGTPVSRQEIVRLTGSSQEPIWLLAEGSAPDAAEIDGACKSFAAQEPRS